jgi:hypothetical protein
VVIGQDLLATLSYGSAYRFVVRITELNNDHDLDLLVQVLLNEVPGFVGVLWSQEVGAVLRRDGGRYRIEI